MFFAVMASALGGLLVGCDTSKGNEPPTTTSSGTADSGSPDPTPRCGQNSECAGFVGGDLCVANVLCLAGRCTVTTAVDCSSLDNAATCRSGVCERTSGKCYLTGAADGAPCPYPTCPGTTAACAAGVCIPRPNEGCDDGDACTVDTCAQGGCRHSAAADGTACPSSNPCLQDMTCAGGACAGGTAVVCTDDNDCTDDACIDGVGCTFTKKPNLGSSSQKVPCQDERPCTGPDYCNSGAICASEGYHNNEGNPCDDKDPCTFSSLCVEGTCRAQTVGGALDIEADGTNCPIPVQDARCWQSASCQGGYCSAVPKPNGTECPEGCPYNPGAPGHCVDGWCKCQ